MHEAVVDGANDPMIEGVEVVSRPALAATAVDVLEADAYVLGTPANLGYMSGALKHFFDTVYYPALDARPGLPYGFWIHGNNDVEGARRALESIAGAMGWRLVADPVLVTGAVDATVREACHDLGGTLAATLMGDA